LLLVCLGSTEGDTCYSSEFTELLEFGHGKYSLEREGMEQMGRIYAHTMAKSGGIDDSFLK
jgi:hypothetical protein